MQHWRYRRGGENSKQVCEDDGRSQRMRSWAAALSRLRGLPAVVCPSIQCFPQLRTWSQYLHVHITIARLCIRRDMIVSTTSKLYAHGTRRTTADGGDNEATERRSRPSDERVSNVVGYITGKWCLLPFCRQRLKAGVVLFCLCFHHFRRGLREVFDEST